MKTRTFALLALLLSAATGGLLLMGDPWGVGRDGADSPESETLDVAPPGVQEGDAEITRSLADSERSRAGLGAGSSNGQWVLEGTVTDANGVPIPGAQVLYLAGVDVSQSRPDWPAQIKKYPGALILGTAEADLDGNWRMNFASRPTGSLDREQSLDWGWAGYGVIAEAEGYWRGGVTIGAEFFPNGGRCAIVLTAGSTLRGVALTPSGEAAAGAFVYHLETPSDLTDAEGGFLVQADPARPNDLFITHPSGTALIENVQALQDARLDLGEIQLEGPGELAGRLQLPDGSPAPYVWLKAWQSEVAADARFSPREKRGGHHFGHTSTDESGRFRFVGLRAAEYRIVCRYQSAELPLRSEASSSFDASARGEITLLLPWRLVVADLPEQQNPVSAELLLSAAPPTADRAQPPPADFSFLTRFSIDSLSRHHALLFDAPGWIRVQHLDFENRSAIAHVEITPERWIYRTSFHPELAVGAGSIQIAVPFETGGKLWGLAHELLNLEDGSYATGRLRRVQSDWLLEEVPAGSWRLSLWPSALEGGGAILPGRFDLQVQAGTVSHVTWIPRSGGLLRVFAEIDDAGADSPDAAQVRVSVLEGPDLAGRDLMFLPSGGRRGDAASSRFAAGVWAHLVGVLQPGAYLLRFSAEGFQAVERRIEILAGETADCEVRLRRAP